MKKNIVFICLFFNSISHSADLKQLYYRRPTTVNEQAAKAAREEFALLINRPDTTTPEQIQKEVNYFICYVLLREINPADPCNTQRYCSRSKATLTLLQEEFVKAYQNASNNEKKICKVEIQEINNELSKRKINELCTRCCTTLVCCAPLAIFITYFSS